MFKYIRYEGSGNYIVTDTTFVVKINTGLSGLMANVIYAYASQKLHLVRPIREFLLSRRNTYMYWYQVLNTALRDISYSYRELDIRRYRKCLERLLLQLRKEHILY